GVARPDRGRGRALASGGGAVRVQCGVCRDQGPAGAAGALRAAGQRRGADEGQGEPGARLQRAGGERLLPAARGWRGTGASRAAGVVRRDDDVSLWGARRPAGRGGDGDGLPARPARATRVVGRWTGWPLVPDRVLQAISTPWTASYQATICSATRPSTSSVKATQSVLPW